MKDREKVAGRNRERKEKTQRAAEKETKETAKSVDRSLSLVELVH